MMRDELDGLGIPSRCRQPDPLLCYKWQTSSEQLDANPCLCCPVASWTTAMVLSDPWTSESIGLEELPVSARWFEFNALEPTGEAMALALEPVFELKAA